MTEKKLYLAWLIRLGPDKIKYKNCKILLGVEVIKSARMEMRKENLLQKVERKENKWIESQNHSCKREKTNVVIFILDDLVPYLSQCS